MSGKPRIRCAIYTRKSTEEGLDQAFNSLDAQFEACAAYIASQKHEGWHLVAERFDDGGLSGGTLERPGLQRLLAEIDAGRIAMVVVYKIDRLTRSLADFVRMVERFDARGCSFVSVTQAFNTSSSMGRLTLNVLLSFAQFEREVTAERIRDKIAASKKKGLWMGGSLPLGYDRHPDPQTRELVVNSAEAQTVRSLFRLYAEFGNLKAVEDEAARRGLHPKRRSKSEDGTGSDAKLRPGTFSRGQLHYLLTNPVYRGLTRHKDKTWPGRHAAIIEEDLWQAVQVKLKHASGRRRGGSASAQAAPLTGLLRDETGDRLTPSHAIKAGKRHRYYVSNRLISGGTDPTAWRLPAAQLERTVAGAIAAHLRRHADRHELLAIDAIGRAEAVATRAGASAAVISKDFHAAAGLIAAGSIRKGALQIQLDPDRLAAMLEINKEHLAPGLARITAPLSLKRRGVELRLISSAAEPHPDATLIRALGRAHLWMDALRRGTSIADLARQTGHAQSQIRTRCRLAFLAPQIQHAILNGRQPAGLTLERILKRGIAFDWGDQARDFGFAAED